MTEPEARRRGGGRGGRGGGGSEAGPAETGAYLQLKHPFAPQVAFSDDQIAAIHDGALRILEELGIRFLLPEARQLFRAGGAIVDEDGLIVRVGREMVGAALATAPKSIRLRAANPKREQDYTLGSMLFMAGCGCPNAYDRERGRRPGTMADYLETLQLQQSFDVMHVLGPTLEPQDVPTNLRHYAMTQAQLVNCDKPMHVYARGRAQVEQCFEMIRLARGLDSAGFEDGAWATTIINSNSPRLYDNPMARGIIDFARAKQLTIITPFCLAGAMAPITVSGALMLQHAEALAGIVLSQLARPGAPVSYGAFLSNVDMKSGSPAFGTPEHVRASIGSGQLARHIGLPWRCAAGAASNAPDSQAAQETTMGLWGATLGGATLTVHAAGWLEGGLTFGYEQFIIDMEAVQTLAELARPAPADAAALGFDAIADVPPSGHFFSTEHTMARYQSAFYRPLLADLSNHGNWVAAGSKTAEERATAIWKQKLETSTPPPACAGVEDRLTDFVRQHSAAGGAKPED